MALMSIGQAICEGTLIFVMQTMKTQFQIRNDGDVPRLQEGLKGVYEGGLKPNAKLKW